MPFFSIITPVYNVENYLEQCVDSVLSQGMGDFELILVDDGSTDSSGHICDRFAALDKRVKVIHQKNSGHIVARMNGVKAARGEYVLFLDSDDYWLPGAFETIKNALEKFSCDVLVYCYSDSINPSGQDYFGEEQEHILADNYLRTNLHYSGMNALYAKAASRRLFDDIDISPFSHFKNSEDMLLSLEIVRRAEKISYIKDAVYFHRLDNPGSITNNFNEAALDEFVASRSALVAQLKLLGCYDEKVKNEFHRSFLFCAANTVLQISSSSKFSRKEKFNHYRRISSMPFFAEATADFDYSQLSRVKALRIILLKRENFFLLYLFDRLRSVLSR